MRRDIYFNGEIEISPKPDITAIEEILARHDLAARGIVVSELATIDFNDYTTNAERNDVAARITATVNEIRAIGSKCNGTISFYGDDEGYIFINEDGSVEETDEEKGIIRCAYTADLLAELKRRGYKVEDRVIMPPKKMDRRDYTIEYCPFCDSEVAIRSHGVTACPECGKPLAPCSVCQEERGGCNATESCPYGCKGGAEDEFKTITNPPMTEEEVSFAKANC